VTHSLTTFFTLSTDVLLSTTTRRSGKGSITPISAATWRTLLTSFKAPYWRNNVTKGPREGTIREKQKKKKKKKRVD
jgi:hypothetical protein